MLVFYIEAPSILKHKKLMLYMFSMQISKISKNVWYQPSQISKKLDWKFFDIWVLRFNKKSISIILHFWVLRYRRVQYWKQLIWYRTSISYLMYQIMKHKIWALISKFHDARICIYWFRVFYLISKVGKVPDAQYILRHTFGKSMYLECYSLVTVHTWCKSLYSS
jgi:hypothetical protein